MHQRNLRLLDLPNEILFIIMKKLNNVDVLYSLLNINNPRLHAIAQAEIFTYCLNFDSISSSGDVSSDILDRFCNEILPQIHHNVKHLIVDSLCMERILRAARYPHLTQLKLLNVNKQIISSYFNADSIFQHIREQITHLHLITNESKLGIAFNRYTGDVYSVILVFLKNLTHLTIIPLSNEDDIPVSLKHLPSTTFFSSTLTKLDIHLELFSDCLALLDGRLKQLNTFIVEIELIESEPFLSYNMDDLPELQCFSLICYNETSSYDSLVIPLLHRMSYLQELTLYVYIDGRPTFVDGIQLQNQILIYMPRLHKLNFYINTTVRSNVPTDPLSNHDIQQTFSNINYGPVVSIVHYYRFRLATCQIFSVPFSFCCLKWLTNNLSPIIFHSVIYLGLWDTVPFQHEFFIRITQSFPSLKHLTVKNDRPPFLWNDDNSHGAQRTFPIVEYPHLTSLTIENVNIAYIDQFLNESKTHLPSLTELTVQFHKLKKVTQNFRRDATRRNCAKVKRLFVENSTDPLEAIRHYFPALFDICSYLDKIRLYDVQSRFFSV